jgi:hypothetical protein
MVLLTIFLPSAALSSAAKDSETDCNWALDFTSLFDMFAVFRHRSISLLFVPRQALEEARWRSGGRNWPGVNASIDGQQTREGLTCRPIWGTRARLLSSQAHMNEVRRGSRNMSDPSTPSNRARSPRCGNAPKGV